jgi:hypothetical protein
VFNFHLVFLSFHYVFDNQIKKEIMKKMKSILYPVALITLIALLIVGTSWTPPEKGCHKINAKGKGITINPSPAGATTEADIIGGGILNGTTRAEFVFTGPPDPQTGEIPFDGELVLTTKHGVLTFNAVNGALNGGTGKFSTELYVIGGTGRFSNATGSLFISGITNLDTGDFTEDISGEICLNK